MYFMITESDMFWQDFSITKSDVFWQDFNMTKFGVILCVLAGKIGQV